MAEHVRQLDINTILMRSTFRIAGRDTLGTVFILGRRVPDSTSHIAYVLVTAAHVLSDIREDEATLFLRTERNGTFHKLPFPLKIRERGNPLWMQHSAADIAAMYVRLPTTADLRLATTDLLASDENLEAYEIHPGDNLFCLGYPYGAEANDAGFPILRSGRIASYPLAPTSVHPTFLFDFRVFGGNSGGPVYLADVNRTYGGSTRLGESLQLIMGLVSQEKMIEEEIRSLTEVRKTKHQLALAVVVSAPLIQQTITMLPAPSIE